MNVRFNDCREIVAKYPGKCHNAKTCGAAVEVGDIIGYARKGRESAVFCQDCWTKWCAENAAADMDEQFYMTESDGSYDGYGY
jgi:hypothetical protein